MKKLFSKIAVLGAMMFGAFTIHGVADKAPVTANAATVQLRGDGVKSYDTGAWTDWGTGLTMNYNSSASRYEIKVNFSKVDAKFKIVVDGNWKGYWDLSRTDNDGAISSSADGDGNFVTAKSGDYLVYINSSYTTLGVEKYVPAVTYNVKFYVDGTLLDTKTFGDGAGFTGSDKEVSKAGYVFEGWYTSPTFEPNTKVEIGTPIKSDLTVYANFIEATDLYVYFKTTYWSAPKVWIWKEGGSNLSASWPGDLMTKVSGTTNLYYFKISKSAMDQNGYDKIIFNNGASSGTVQSGNLDLSYDLIFTATGSATNITSKSTTTFREVVAHINGDALAYTELTYTGTASTNGISAMILSKGTVALDSKVEAAEAKTALINRMQKVDTCAEYAKYADYKEMASKVSGYESIEIVDKDQATGAATARVSIGDKLAYMELLAGVKAASEEKANENGIILSLTNENSNVSLIALFAILGLVAVSAYYFIEKKKLAK